MIRLLHIQPSVASSVNASNSHAMVSRLLSKHFRFLYTFDSGHELVGCVEGNYFDNAPSLVFNLRALKAICLDPQGNLLISFDEVFGQFNTNTPEVLFSGSRTTEGSFFSFNYRGSEATIYDALTDDWITTGWNPNNWAVEEFTPPRDRAVALPLNHPIWATWVSA